MARITDIYLIETAAQNAITIQTEVSVSKIPEVISGGFLKLDEYIKTKKRIPSNIPFLKIIGNNPDAIQVTIGMEISEAVEGSDDIEQILIPAGKKIFCYWIGDNSQMELLYVEMQKFAEEKGYGIQEGFYEYYLNGPEYGEENLLTKVVMILK